MCGSELFNFGVFTISINELIKIKKSEKKLYNFRKIFYSFSLVLPLTKFFLGKFVPNRALITG